MTRLHEIVLQYNVLYWGWKGVQEAKLHRNTKLYCDRRLGAGLGVLGAGRRAAAGGARRWAGAGARRQARGRTRAGRTDGRQQARAAGACGRWACGVARGRAQLARGLGAGCTARRAAGLATGCALGLFWAQFDSVFS